MQTQSARTTVDLDWEKVSQLKQLALMDRITLKEAISRAVGEYVERRRPVRRGPLEILKEMKQMSSWGKRGVNLTQAVIKERERLSKKGL